MSPEQCEPLKVSEPRIDKMRFVYCMGQLRSLRFIQQTVTVEAVKGSLIWLWSGRWQW